MTSEVRGIICTAAQPFALLFVSTRSFMDICLLALDQIEDPQNFGQIIRTAECAGINGIIFPMREHEISKILSGVHPHSVHIGKATPF